MRPMETTQTTGDQLLALADLIRNAPAGAEIRATVGDDDGWGNAMTRLVVGLDAERSIVRLAPNRDRREVVERIRGLVEIDVLTINGRSVYTAEEGVL
jgi:hypothetical protein